MVATPTPSALPTIVPTQAPTTSGTAVVSGTFEAASATAVDAKPTTPSPLPTVEPTLAAQVGQAYEEFWRVKSKALLELDPTHLPDVMDGEYLNDTRDLIDQLQAEGRAIKTQVSLNYTVVEASTDTATIVDNFVDNSVYVTAGTDDALSDPTADHLSVLYRLNRISDSWKVVQSVRSP
jgi:hypothetical protein